MSLKLSVQEKMETIQSTFLRVQDMFFESPDWKRHVVELEATHIEFRSIAYESASMSIALEDLKQGEHLTNWFRFLNEAASVHATQVHVGLGWAFAQQLIIPMPYLAELNPILRYRVLDGYGYYEGVFRRRRSIINQLKLEVEDVVASSAFDQGLGRSIWYLNKGIFDDAKSMIEGFAVERQKDLWRGLGIAMAYVGGCSDEQLLDIFSKAEVFKPQLATGALMALVSRNESGCTSADTIQTVESWWNADDEALQEIINATGKDETQSHAYQNWIDKIELYFTERNL
jgi:hypothetical protein